MKRLIFILTATVLSTASASGLYALRVTATIPVEGNAWTVNVTPTFELDVVPPHIPVANSKPRLGMTVPYVMFINPELNNRTLQKVVRTEEFKHSQQWSALGPGFLIAYGLTAGVPFEPYDPFTVDTSFSGGYDQHQMWTPTEAQLDDCPLFTIQPHSLSIAHCYTGVTVNF